jgi:hypothetical protein
MINGQTPDREPGASADDDRPPPNVQEQPESMEDADVANGEGDPEADR